MAGSVDSIIGEIRVAFAGVRRGRITIHEAEVIDSRGDDDQRRLARKQDSESDWECVPDQDIEECCWALPHLDPESWRYYIPAYMIWTLTNFRSSDSVVSDFTIYTFEPYLADPQMRAHATDRFGLLNEPQSRAVCQFLRHMAADEDNADAVVATRVVDEFWGRFCNDSDMTSSVVD